jgi:GTP-binding protein EngB required for normal cell division
MIEWANTYQRPVLVILTKTDKLNQNELILHKRDFSAPCPTLYYSIKDRNARIALIETLNHQLSAHGTC